MSERYTLHLGDNLEAIRAMADNSIDSIVTDPPYGISMMNAKWDYDVPSVETWRECLRVLKPGGHLLAFAGTRTQHRMAVNIEDAGFEIRDMIAWVYGSGFPKSYDVSKAIDRDNGEANRLLKFTAWMRTTGLSAKTINERTGTFMGSHYLTDKTQPAIPTPEIWEIIRPLCADIPEWVDELVKRIAAEREVVKNQRGTLLAVAPGQENDRSATTLSITAPATDAAKQWAGWGTALKPAMEPITVARKPLQGTVASNVLEYGTGGLNIDGCRVGAEITLRPLGKTSIWGRDAGGAIGGSTSGRWPANLIHDGSEEVTELLDSADRFFYCAKASNADRNEGLEGRNHHPTVKPTDLMRYLCRLVTPPGGLILDHYMGSGSTGKAAMLEGFRFVGCEMEPEYMEIARARIAHAASQVVQQELL